MKARMPAGFGRPDMNALMRQAQKMQEDMKAIISIIYVQLKQNSQYISQMRRV